jgi:hypothetical protein
MRRMKQTLLAAIVVLATASTAGTASAGGLPGSIGVGAEFNLSTVGGLSVNYDTGKFHVGGFFGYFDPDGDDNDDVNIGGRFFYHVASTASSDFSVGGSLAIQSQATVGDRATLVFVEPGFQIRVFVVPNVAVSFLGGISVGAGDAHDVRLTGNLNGTAGIHYYF